MTWLTVTEYGHEYVNRYGVWTWIC